MMNKIALIFFFSTCLAVSAQELPAEKTAVDSFAYYLELLQKKTSRDSVYVHTVAQYYEKAKRENAYQHIFQAYIYKVTVEPDLLKKHQFADSLFLLNNRFPNKSNEIRALQTKSMVYYVEKDYPKMLEYELKVLALVDKKSAPYEYYKSLYSIGQVYFYMQQYEEASEKFREARVYFSSLADYSMQRGFFNSIRYEALSAYYLGNYSKSYSLVQSALDRVSILKHYADFEAGYLNLVLGMNLYQKKEYQQSLKILDRALLVIQGNEDYANEGLAYYYIGLNYTALGEKKEAVRAFKNVDETFKAYAYINFEIWDSYNYLVAYFKGLNDTEQQLYYTDQQLKASVYLQHTYKSLSSTLHKKLEIERLKKDKERLQKSMNKQSRKLFFTLLVGIPAFCVALYFWVLNSRKRKHFHQQYEASEQLRKSEGLAHEKRYEQKVLELEEEAKRTSKPLAMSKDKERNLLKQLQAFEFKEQYLEKDLNLTQLARRWGTNRTYLSHCINTHKGKSFVDYVNSLRIAYFMAAMESNNKWQVFKISAIAQELGFNCGRNFSDAFIKQMGYSPSFYIEQKRNSENATQTK